MSDNDSKLMKGTVVVKYPPEILARVEKKSSFSFDYSGGECRVTFQDGELTVISPSDAGSEFLELIEGVKRLKQQLQKLDETVAMNFLSKFTKVMAKYHAEFNKHAIYEVIDSEPVDLDSMPLRERCVAELVMEQHEKAERAGSNKITLTKEMLDRKIREKMERNAA